MKIGFTKIKKKYVVLAVAIFGYYVWTISPAKVREILRNSDIVAQEYENGIKQAMIDGKKEIYLRDIVKSVKWDNVYSYSYDFDHYENSREMLHKIIGRDYPELNFLIANDEFEESIIFVYKGDITAVVTRNKNSFIELIKYFIFGRNFIDEIGFPKCEKCNGKLVFYKSFEWQGSHKTCSSEQAINKTAELQKCSSSDIEKNECDIEKNECCIEYIGD